MVGCFGQSWPTQDLDLVARARIRSPVAQAVDGAAKVIIAAIDQILPSAAGHAPH